jgi:TRAP-type C4-dicarboxylate transport system substrate-binding protein
MAPSVLIISQQIWDELSKDDQAIIRAAAKESVAHLRKRWDEQEIAERQLLDKAGVQIVADALARSAAGNHGSSRRATLSA